MPNVQQLLETVHRKLSKVILHLEYSYKKISALPTDVNLLDDAALEAWESFAARFSRVSDIFLTQYLRTKVLENDPGFEGSLRDFLNQAEKLKLIDDAQAWLNIREMRNVTVHDYSEKDLSFFFQRLKEECPRLLKITLE